MVFASRASSVRRIRRWPISCSPIRPSARPPPHWPPPPRRRTTISSISSACRPPAGWRPRSAPIGSRWCRAYRRRCSTSLTAGRPSTTTAWRPSTARHIAAVAVSSRRWGGSRRPWPPRRASSARPSTKPLRSTRCDGATVPTGPASRPMPAAASSATRSWPSRGPGFRGS